MTHSVVANIRVRLEIDCCGDTIMSPAPLVGRMLAEQLEGQFLLAEGQRLVITEANLQASRKERVER